MSDPIELLSAFEPFGSGARPSAARYLLLDVFADEPFRGNQLAVMPDARGIDGHVMQSLACELKLSETVFVVPAESDGDARVRIFTPTAEMPFAGHPVLGAAVVAARALERTEVILETGSGNVAVGVSIDGAFAAQGRMRQPIPTWAVFEHERALLAALGIERSTMPVELYSNGPQHVMVGLESPRAVAELTPDPSALARLGPLCVSCFAGEGRRWKTRMFAPALGVPEDPATGSAAGPLAVHLARHERIAFGVDIEIRQGEEIGRASLLTARVEGEGGRIDSVEVAGRALIVGCGELLLP